MPVLELKFASGEESLSVRRFTVSEGISRLFDVTVWARSPNDDIDLEALVGQPATLGVAHGVVHTLSMGTRSWVGVCAMAEQVQAEPTGLSTYQLRIVPSFWMLDHRRNHRIFQHKSIPEIVDQILGEWNVAHEPKLEYDYPKLEYRVQYGESDYAFVCRMLEEAGIAFYFENGTGKMILRDKPQGNDLRSQCPIDYVDNPNEAAEREFVTTVSLTHEVRPGRFKIRDFDFRRKPDYALFGDATPAPAPEDKLEQFTYSPASFLVDGGSGGGTPVADDQSVARREEKVGKARAERSLEALRASKVHVAYHTNCIDIAPGTVISIGRHPRADLAPGKKLLVTDVMIDGVVGEAWHAGGSAMFADTPYRPPFRSRKPHIFGVQTAVVVGPPGQEIYTDEFGRVRVQFPWDREGKWDDHSSCWMRVSQGWAGTGYGLINIPRIGHEVLVAFEDGNVDSPLVVGRVFNQTSPVPYKLPENKTRSTWKSDTSPGHGGFNELTFEDLKDKELVYEQAQKNRRRLVKNDETITVGNDRQKLVKANEQQHIVASRMLLVGANEDVVVKKVKKARVEGDSSLRVKGNRKQKIEKSQSLTVGEDQQEKVGKKHALEAGREIHLKSGDKLVIEAAQDLTIKGPGGFMRIDASGVTIKGLVVKINSGGSPGSGSGSSPDDPDDAAEATPEDVTGIGQ